jgi:hypothetical protein
MHGYTQRSGTFVLFPYTKLQILSSNVSLIVTMKVKVKEHVIMAATLIYLLQKHYPNKNKIFFNDH